MSKPTFTPRAIPPSDHYDGKRFFNPGAKAVSFKDFLRWQFTRKPRPWPKHMRLPQTDLPPLRVDDSDLRASYVGHATVLLQTGGLNILTDPVWAERVSPFSFIGPKRVHRPGVIWSALPLVDIVLLSHNHYDHMDLETLRKLQARDKPLFVVPLGNGKYLPTDARIVELDWGEAHEHADATITLERAQHWSSRKGFDRNRALWGSFIVKTSGGSVYFAGDSGYAPHFKDIGAKHGPFRLALLPIGAYEPRWFMGVNHMAPDEAVQAFRDLGSPPSFALHYTTFRLADDGYGDAARGLAAARAVQGVDETAFRLLPPGESWTSFVFAQPQAERNK